MYDYYYMDMELLWINTYKYKQIRGWTSSELPAILGFTKGTRFLPIPIYEYLLGGWPTPLKNMSSSVGVIIPNIWKHKTHVPNHQPDMHLYNIH